MGVWGKTWNRAVFFWGRGVPGFPPVRFRPLPGALCGQYAIPQAVIWKLRSEGVLFNAIFPGRPGPGSGIREWRRPCAVPASAIAPHAAMAAPGPISAQRVPAAAARPATTKEPAGTNPMNPAL